MPDESTERSALRQAREEAERINESLRAEIEQRLRPVTVPAWQPEVA